MALIRDYPFATRWRGLVISGVLCSGLLGADLLPTEMIGRDFGQIGQVGLFEPGNGQLHRVFGDSGIVRPILEVGLFGALGVGLALSLKQSLEGLIRARDRRGWLVGFGWLFLSLGIAGLVYVLGGVLNGVLG